MDRKTERFFEEFDDLAFQVTGARAEDFDRYLRMWIQSI